MCFSRAHWVSKTCAWMALKEFLLIIPLFIPQIHCIQNTKQNHFHISSRVLTRSLASNNRQHCSSKRRCCIRRWSTQWAGISGWISSPIVHSERRAVGTRGTASAPHQCSQSGTCTGCQRTNQCIGAGKRSLCEWCGGGTTAWSWGRRALTEKEKEKEKNKQKDSTETANCNWPIDSLCVM